MRFLRAYKLVLRGMSIRISMLTQVHGGPPNDVSFAVHHPFC